MEKVSRRQLLIWTGLAVLVTVIAVGLSWMRYRGLPYGVARDLASAEQYELISLDPNLLLKPPLDSDPYYGFRILGRTTIADPQVRLRLNAALQAAVRESDDSRAACFNPRHAVRVTRGASVLDCVICFECRSMYFYRDGKQVGSIAVTDKQEAVFDDILQKAGVPLAPKRE